MTEGEASDQLERAVRDWLHATDMDEGGKHYLTGWVLISEHAHGEDMSASLATITASDGMTRIRQMGLLEYARVIARADILDD